MRYSTWSTQWERKFMHAHSNNAIFDEENDNSFECIN